MQSLTTEIISGVNILSLASFVVMALTVGLSRIGQAGKALNIGLMCVGTVLVFVGPYVGGGARYRPLLIAIYLTRISSAGTPSTFASADLASAPCRTSALDHFPLRPLGR
jgi:hypothetical protein